jgi:hypothetical protein
MGNEEREEQRRKLNRRKEGKYRINTNKQDETKQMKIREVRMQVRHAR